MKKGARYSNMTPGAQFGFLVNAIDKGLADDGDTGAGFPRTDAEDMSRGARFIPGEVTLARRAGKKVQFSTDCDCASCWYWQMPDGTKIYYYDATESRHMEEYHGGVCPECGNKNLGGGTFGPDGKRKV